MSPQNELFNAGRRALEEGEYELAVQQFCAVLQVLPTCVDALNNLGAAYCQLRAYPRALEAYARIGDDDRIASTWYNIALTHFYCRDYEQALRCLQRCLELDAHDLAALDLRGRIYIDREAYQAAMESFQAAFVASGKLTFLLWEVYALYLLSEFSPELDDLTHKRLLHHIIRRLERVERFTDPPERAHAKPELLPVMTMRHAPSPYRVSKRNTGQADRAGLTEAAVEAAREQAEVRQKTMYFLGCAYARSHDFTAALTALTEGIAINPASPVAALARSLLDQVWNTHIKPPWWKWWLQSPVYLGGRLKVALFGVIFLLFVSLLLFFLFHPFISMTFPGVTVTPDWSVLLFVAGLLLVVILSPSVEQIKTKEIEVKVHATPPVQPFPPSAIWEAYIGAMAEERAKTQHRHDAPLIIEPALAS